MSKSESLRDERDMVKSRVQNLGASIAEVRKPFETAMANATKAMYAELDTLQKREYALTNLYEKALRDEIAETWANKAPTKDTFHEWLRQSGEWEKMFPKESRLYGYDIRHSQRNVGDITILAETENYAKFYVAFRGNKVVGYMCVEPSQHPGDSTRVPIAVVNGKPLQMVKDSSSGWGASVVKPLEQFTKALIREFGIPMGEFDK